MAGIKNNRIDYVTAKVLLLYYVLDNVESGGILYLGDNIYNAYADGKLLGLKNFTLKSGSFYGWYDYAIELSPKCKSYLKNILQVEKHSIHYFVHYAVFQGEKCVMKVFDGDCIGIDKSIKIPNWLLEACERNEVWINFDDEIKI